MAQNNQSISLSSSLSLQNNVVVLVPAMAVGVLRCKGGLHLSGAIGAIIGLDCDGCVPTLHLD